MYNFKQPKTRLFNKASQANSTKPFTIPTEPANEKVTQAIDTKQTAKLTQKFGLELIGPITFIGYDKFDPFTDMKEKGNFKIPEYMQTKTEPKRSDRLFY
ncbi:MAG: hypothetical protein LBH25_00925 [Fibromonadaceae bacterium]|jgi:hypothetical protein|nr:hypothetical protein [Fibromonadaceae bacterium]